MGQDQGRPADADDALSHGQPQTAGGGPATKRSPSGLEYTAAYNAEQAKMVHVTTAGDVKQQLPEHEIEAQRLLSELRELTPVRPLIPSSSESSFSIAVNKEERIAEEVLKKSTLANYKIPHDRSVKAMATYQTMVMREAAQATARTEELISKMQHTSYLCTQLKTMAWHRAHESAVLNRSLAEAERLSSDVSGLAKEVHETCTLVNDIQQFLSDDDRHALKLAIEEDNMRQAAELRSQNSSMAAPPSTGADKGKASTSHTPQNLSFVSSRSTGSPPSGSAVPLPTAPLSSSSVGSSAAAAVPAAASQPAETQSANPPEEQVQE